MIGDLNDWTLLRFFLETARAGSIQGATETLGASQPTIGRKIDQLEAKVGAKLFIRTSAGVDLTEAGRRVVKIAEGVAALTRSLVLETSTEQQLSGTVRFMVTDGIGGYWIPYLLEDFHTSYPNITLDVTCCDAAKIPDLSRRETDVTVVYRQPTDPDVSVLFHTESVGVMLASEAYAEKYGLPTTFDELRDHRFCGTDIHFSKEGPMSRLAEALEGHTRIAYRSNSSIAVAQAIRCGFGITCFPIGVIEREPGVVAFDLEGWRPVVPFWLVCHRNVKDLPVVRVLVDHLKSSLRKGGTGNLARPEGSV